VKFLPSEFPDGLTATDAITADYTYFTGLIQNTQLHIDGDATDRTNYPGYRAAGVQVRVLSPTIVQLSFTANITVAQGYAQEDVADAVSSAIQTYVNNLGIDEDVVLAELVERAMSVPGMYNINIVNPSEDRIILENQVARILAGNINIT
jgi:phage-related baseplate assembly protein